MKALIACCFLVLLISPVESLSLWPFSSKTTPAPYYYNNNGYNNGYGNGVYYNPPTTTRASYIKNALKGAAVGALASSAYTWYKNGKK